MLVIFTGTVSVVPRLSSRRGLSGSPVAIALVLSSVMLTAQQPKPQVRVPKTAPAPSLTPTGVPAPSAADAATIAEVLAFEKQMEAAVVRGDVKFLDHALSPDFIFTHGDGWTSGGAPLKVDTKASWLAYVAKQPPPYFYRELDHVQVELHGNIARVKCSREGTIVEQWQAAANWHRTLKKAEAGTLLLDPNGVEFRSAKVHRRWEYVDIHTFDLSERELTLSNRPTPSPPR